MAFLDEDTIEWHFETWAWLFENFGGFSGLQDTQMLLPTRDFFPHVPSMDSAYFESLFEVVKGYMGMSDWPCEFEVFEDSDPTGELFKSSGLDGSWSHDGAAGTFEVTDERVVIRCALQQANDQSALIATLAHELCHYLLHSARTDPPSGWDDHELHTDLTSVFCGFGIFHCNAAFNFRSSSGDLLEGGSYGCDRQGYMPEPERTYDLALFCKLKDISPEKLINYLKPNPRSSLKKALADLQRRESWISQLKNIV
jgi:hypothetical protein